MSTVAALSPLAQRLAAIVGEQHVTSDTNGCDVQGIAAATTVAPSSAEEVAEVLRLAWKDGLVVIPFGGGSHQEIGAPPEKADILLRTQRLQAVEHYDPGDLTLGIGAGATVDSVREMTAAHSQLFAVDPVSPVSTVGGVLATAWHGPLKHGYGGARDFCLGIRFVTADGKIAKAGGRVVKNVAGYDMMKLLIGSFGTLAVITGASFKLFPAARQTATFECEFAGMAGVTAFRNRILRSPLSPMCVEIVSPYAHGALTGGSPDAGNAWRVLVRAGGSDAVLARYRAELGADVTREIRGRNEAELWQQMARFVLIALERGHNSAILRLDLPIQAAAKAIEAVEQAALDNNFLPAIVGRIATGSLLAALLPIAVDPPGVNQYINAVSSLRAALPRDGSAIVLRCPREAKRHIDMWGSSPSDVPAMKALKNALDGKNIFNRGRFLF